MADKLAATISSNINFSSGETPTATKLNSIFNILKNSIQKLELAIGDLHDESYPYFDSTDTLTQATRSSLEVDLGNDKKLDIANLARLIGPASSLNPLHLSDLEGAETYVTEALGSSINSFKLKYPPLSGTLSFSGSDTSAFASLKASSATALIDGDYYINYTTGEITTIKTIVSGVSVTYQPVPTWGPYASYTSASFNVIPDPSQSTKCAATGPTSGLYTISLPVIERQELDDTGLTTIIGTSHINYGAQLKLPYVLSGLAEGDLIPKGFLILRDDTSNTLFKDASYYYVSQDEVKVGGATLDTSHEFSIITTGTNITQSIQDLNIKLWRMRRGLDGYTSISVDSIANKTGTTLASGQEPYVESEIDNNPFAQYLHRDGWFSSEDDQNINDQNGLRGDLVLLSNKRTSNSRNNLTSNSRKLYFGEHTNGPNIYYLYHASVPRLVINGNGKLVHVDDTTYGLAVSGGVYMGGVGSPWPKLKCIEQSLSVDFVALGSGSSRDPFSVSLSAGVTSELTGKTILGWNSTYIRTSSDGYIYGGDSTDFSGTFSESIYSFKLHDDFTAIRFIDYNASLLAGTLEIIFFYRD